jgi:CheY-like chemotaxis protein
MATRILVVDDSPTIRTVVSRILERSGYEAEVAYDGQDAYDLLATGRVRADLVLVDFVMPRMNGYQFCRALRDDPELATMPVVLMSAKADRIRDQFVQQTGAVDAITKPFDAQALSLVVENALRKMNTQRASEARASDFDDDTSVIGTAPAAPVEVENETRRTHVAQIIATKLASITTEALAKKNPGTEFEKELEERLSKEAVVDMMEALSDLARKDDSLLAGDLAAVPVGAVLQLLQAENQTGVLVCTNGAAEVRAAFRNGTIDLVQSTGAGDEFRLGRFFVEEGILTPAEIDEFSSMGESEAKQTARRPAWGLAPLTDDDPHATETRPGTDIVDILAAGLRQQQRPLGMMLLAAGKISESQLKTALVRQSSELLYEVLRWQHGRFELRREAPSELAESARLGLPVASVVMEGFRRVDEWRALERSLGSFDHVLTRDDAAFGTLDVQSLPPREKAVLDAVDGERTVRQIVSASHVSSFDACRILVQFLEARVLRPRLS